MTHRNNSQITPPTWAGFAPLRWHIGVSVGIILVFIISGLVF